MILVRNKVFLRNYSAFKHAHNNSNIPFRSPKTAFFFAFGVAMERRFGWKWFLFLYLGGGIFSGLCQIGTDSALRHGLSTTPLVGASGAIAAAMGAFLRSYPTSKIKILVWFLRPRTGMLHAWIFLGGWFLVQFLHSHFGVKDPNGGVAYIAHVSGFFFGFVVAQFLPVDPEIAERDRPARAIPRTGIVSGFDASIATDDPPQRDERPILDQAWNAVHAGFDEEAADLFTSTIFGMDSRWRIRNRHVGSRNRKDLDPLPRLSFRTVARLGVGHEAVGKRQRRLGAQVVADGAGRCASVVACSGDACRANGTCDRSTDPEGSATLAATKTAARAAPPCFCARQTDPTRLDDGLTHGCPSDPHRPM